jgi:hypothetical protein
MVPGDSISSFCLMSQPLRGKVQMATDNAHYRCLSAKVSSDSATEISVTPRRVNRSSNVHRSFTERVSRSTSISTVFS